MTSINILQAGTPRYLFVYVNRAPQRGHLFPLLLSPAYIRPAVVRILITRLTSLYICAH